MKKNFKKKYMDFLTKELVEYYKKLNDLMPLRLQMVVDDNGKQKNTLIVKNFL
jgi:hypothetical protein